MGARAIPEVGQKFLGDKPAARKMLHVTFGVASADPDVAVLETGVYTLVDITVPAVITDVWTMVAEAFGGTVTVDIGDSDDVDRYTSDTTIASNATGVVLVADTLVAAPYLTATSPLDIEVTIGGASVDAGLCHVYVEYYEIQD